MGCSGVVVKASSDTVALGLVLDVQCGGVGGRFVPGNGVSLVGFVGSEVTMIEVVDDTGCINFVFN